MATAMFLRSRAFIQNRPIAKVFNWCVFDPIYWYPHLINHPFPSHSTNHNLPVIVTTKWLSIAVFVYCLPIRRWYLAMPQKVWKIRTEAAKDDRGCQRTFKAVLRASEDVWRVPKGSVCQMIHRFFNSYNTGQDQWHDQKSHLHIVVFDNK